MAGGWNYSLMLDYDNPIPKSPYDEICKMLTMTETEFENWQRFLKYYKLDKFLL